MQVEAVADEQVTDERLDLRALDALDVLRPGELAGTCGSVSSSPTEKQASGCRINLEDVLGEDAQVVERCAGAPRPGEVARDCRVRRELVERKANSHRAKAAVERLLQAEDVAIGDHVIDRRVEPGVEGIVEVGEVVEREETRSWGWGDWFSAIFNPRTEGTSAEARRGLGVGGGCPGGKGGGIPGAAGVTRRIVRGAWSPII